MTSNGEPADSGHGDDWVFVTHDEHNDDRHPQYNSDNESSGQKAKASTPTDRAQTYPDDDMSTEQENDHSALCRKTESNGTLTETASTDTMTGPCVSSVARSTGFNIDPAAAVLTEYSLRRLQKELSQSFPANISGWLEGTTGFNPYAHTNDFESSMQHSMLVRFGKSKASTMSSMSLEFEPAPPSRSRTHDVFGAGAWC